MQYSAIIGAGTFALTNFGQLFPSYHCPNIHLEKEDYQSTHSVPFECGVLYNCSNRTVLRRYFKSMTDEWDLVCDRAEYLKIILLASAMGRIVGWIVGGHIGMNTNDVIVWYAFAVCSFLVGLCYGIGETSVFVLIMEITSSKHRWIPNSCLQWCLQYPIVALIGIISYLTGNWRMYLIIINVIFAPLLVFYMLFMESPRYLIYHEQFERAAKTLSDIASDRWNDRTGTTTGDIEPEQFSEIPTRTTDPADPKYPSPLELFRTTDRARLTITLMVAMFFRSVVSNLFIIDASDESGNPFINIGLHGVVSLWVPFFIVLMDRKVKKFGRRACFLVFQSALLLGLVVMVAMGLTNTLNGLSLRILGLIGAALGASGSWMAIAQFIIEAYPTAIRGLWLRSASRSVAIALPSQISTRALKSEASYPGQKGERLGIAYGWIECFDGMGSLVTPYILGLDAVWSQLPVVIMLIMAIGTIIGGYFILPETKGGTLRDGMHEFQFKDKESDA